MELGARYSLCLTFKNQPLHFCAQSGKTTWLSSIFFFNVLILSVWFWSGLQIQSASRCFLFHINFVLCFKIPQILFVTMLLKFRADVTLAFRTHSLDPPLGRVDVCRCLVVSAVASNFIGCVIGGAWVIGVWQQYTWTGGLWPSPNSRALLASMGRVRFYGGGLPACPDKLALCIW